jgi:hypothetical protein
MNIHSQIKFIKKYLPSLYDTRYSKVFTLYGAEVNLNKLRSNIIIENELRKVFIIESPHFRCAFECLNNDEKIYSILHLDRHSVVEYIETCRLVHSLQYIRYIEQAHPETDAIESFVNFLHIIKIYSKMHSDCVSNVCVLVQQRVDHNGNNFWLLIDGLHRSSILLALNKLMVRVRVKIL